MPHFLSRPHPDTTYCSIPGSGAKNVRKTFSLTYRFSQSFFLICWEGLKFQSSFLIKLLPIEKSISWGKQEWSTLRFQNPKSVSFKISAEAIDRESSFQKKIWYRFSWKSQRKTIISGSPFSNLQSYLTFSFINHNSGIRLKNSFSFTCEILSSFFTLFLAVTKYTWSLPLGNSDKYRARQPNPWG